MSEKNSDRLNIRELWHTIEEYIYYFLSKWKIISAVVLLAIVAGFFYAYRSKKVYIGRLTFALEEKSGGLSSYAALASQFGIDLGGSSSSAFSGDNLLELMKSRMIIEKTLLTSVDIDGKPDLLVNRYIQFNKLEETWNNNEVLKDLKFNINVPRSKFSLEQDSALNVIQATIAKQSITINRFDKRLNLVYIECRSRDELFAKLFTETLVANASSFYIETKTKKSRSNVAILEHKTDSIKKLLDNLLYSSAVFQDKNLNIVRATNKVSSMQKQIDIQLFTAVYIELSKNLELASFALMKEEPLVQVIDTPIFPLRFEKPGKFRSMIVFGTVGGVMIMFILLIVKIFKKELKKEI
jgi:hypothetical protein